MSNRSNGVWNPDSDRQALDADRIRNRVGNFYSEARYGIEPIIVPDLDPFLICTESGFGSGSYHEQAK